MQSIKNAPLAEEVACAKRTQARHEKIAKRAFQIYLAHGCKPGDSLSNWYEAVREYELEDAHQPKLCCGCGGCGDDSSDS